MPEESILSDDFIRELINVGQVDIVVAVPSYNDGHTIGKVVQALRAGLLTYFPRARSVIINADGGSRDGTQDLVRAASISDLSLSADVHALRTLHCISAQYEGGPASGIALHTILAAADLLQAKACAVVSPESTTIEPEWMIVTCSKSSCVCGLIASARRGFVGTGQMKLVIAVRCT